MGIHCSKGKEQLVSKFVVWPAVGRRGANRKVCDTRFARDQTWHEHRDQIVPQSKILEAFTILYMEQLIFDAPGPPHWAKMGL